MHDEFTNGERTKRVQRTGGQLHRPTVEALVAADEVGLRAEDQPPSQLLPKLSEAYSLEWHDLPGARSSIIGKELRTGDTCVHISRRDFLMSKKVRQSLSLLGQEWRRRAKAAFWINCLGTRLDYEWAIPDPLFDFDSSMDRKFDPCCLIAVPRCSW